MKRIAFFVEGQTEQIFVRRLVKEILGYDSTTVILKKITGGTNAPKHEFVKSFDRVSKAEYTALIYDCGADNRVKSEILDNIESLRDNGYSYIVGVRDLYPLPVEELPRLEKGLNFLPHNLRDCKGLFDIIVVVQEVETWFLAETNHFMKVDRRLTGRFIEKRLGYNPYLINPLTRKHPSEDLGRIYKLVGRSYTKKFWQIDRLVKRLDFKKIRHEIRYEMPPLNELVTIIENFKKQKEKEKKLEKIL